MMKKRINDLQSYIDANRCVSVQGIPGVGISLFLKYVCATCNHYCIYVDVFSLPSLEPKEVFKNMLFQLGETTYVDQEQNVIYALKAALKKRKDKIVICFAGFDQLEPVFSKEFFYQLRSLREINRGKVIYIFGICKQIEQLLSRKLLGADLSILSTVYYLKPFDYEEAKTLFTFCKQHYEDGFSEKFKLSGGHIQLLQLLLQVEDTISKNDNPFTNLALESIYTHLNYKQKKLIEKKILNKSEIKDAYLQNVGLVKYEKEKQVFFSPLFERYVQKKVKSVLPKKEAALLHLLTKKMGEIVAREEICQEIWPEKVGDVSDWALDALVYRLRKHQNFIHSGYIIENYKKRGYMLIDK